ncbi:hypothetical protein BGX31_002819 [Mortierella sp. GBA43]|nr:hypothetical protein BGX31_002819 [Mortierella sp. GBA43]
MAPDNGSLTIRQAWNEYHGPISEAKLADPKWPYTAARSKAYRRRRELITLIEAKAQADGRSIEVVLATLEETYKDRTINSFEEWLRQGSFEPGVNPAILVVNWLHYVQVARKLKWSTIMTMKSAILALFSDPEAIREDPYYIEFLKAAKKDTVVEIKSIDFDITPILDFFREQPHSHEMDIERLTWKLCWLLGVCGFMRPDDVRCTDIKASQITRGKLQLVVSLSKERRDGQRIIKTLTIDPHTDRKLCPVNAYTAYIARLTHPELSIPHPKDLDRTLSPLIRYAKDHSKVATTTTIGQHMARITRMMQIPDKKAPKLRALGSTLAAIAGVPVVDIMVQGSWSSPKMFEKTLSFIQCNSQQHLHINIRLA